MNTEITQRTKRDLQKESQTKRVWLFITLSMLGALLLTTIALVLIDRLGNGNEASPVAPTQQQPSGWSYETVPDERITVTRSAFVVINDTEATVFDSVSGEELLTLNDPAGDLIAAPLQDGLIVFSSASAWLWQDGHEQFTLVELPRDAQVRVLGDKAFSISEDRETIQEITLSGKLKPLTPPVSGAVPLTAVNGVIVWTTGGEAKLIRTNGNEVVSEATLEKPEGAAGITRRLGAGTEFAFIIWERGEEQVLVVHDLETGKAKTSHVLKGSDDAVWRVSTNRAVAYFDGLVIDATTGAIVELADPLAEPVALSSTIIGKARDGNLVEFGASAASIIEGVKKVHGQFADGSVLTEDRKGVLGAVDELPLQDLNPAAHGQDS